MKTRISFGLIGGVALVAASALAMTLSQPTGAHAQVAAKVESQTRPNFGVLLDPPTRNYRGRSHRRYDYFSHRPDWRPGYPGGFPGGPGGQEVVLVDCGGNPGTGAVEDAVRRVRPGGTLVIRARAGACVGWLNIDKPMTIIGEGGFDAHDWDRHPTPTLQAPDGLPCMTVAQGVRVEIRDMIFASPHGGDAACIVGYGAEIVMSRVGLRYAGDEAAIYADGGLVDLRGVFIDASTVAPAVVADGTTFTAYDLTIAEAQSGLELTPGAGQTSRIASSMIKGTGAPNAFGPRSIGLNVRSGREYGRVEVVNTAICGYVEGVAIEGASVDIQNSRICHSDKGVVLYNGELSLTGSRIRATSIGVAAASGHAVITNNSFSGIDRDVIYRENATVQASGNRVWSKEVCAAQFRDRYRDRYEPYWSGGEGWECVYGAYPRRNWDDEDGILGLPYQDDGYQLDGYDRFQDGEGWYDRSGHYVDQSRPRGDDRWRGGWGRR